MADRPTPPAVPRPSRLSCRRWRDAAGPAESPHHRRPETAPGAGAAGPPASPAAARIASPGLLAHFALERAAAMPPPDADPARQTAERLAECCRLLDCMAVK